MTVHCSSCSKFSLFPLSKLGHWFSVF
uniref:Uncharacterized protein n=1 Tax=Anguilla anguilla TaxID=7936 RepID=A0A0E9W0A5_ANGAN